MKSMKYRQLVTALRSIAKLVVYFDHTIARSLLHPAPLSHSRSDHSFPDIFLTIDSFSIWNIMVMTNSYEIERIRYPQENWQTIWRVPT
jgi:hypothetical protein